MISVAECIPIENSQNLYLKKSGDDYLINSPLDLSLDPSCFWHDGTSMASLIIGSNQTPFNLSWELKDSTGRVIESSEAWIQLPKDSKGRQPVYRVMDHQESQIWKTETQGLFEPVSLDFTGIYPLTGLGLNETSQKEDTPYQVPETDFSDLLSGSPGTGNVLIEAPAAYIPEDMTAVAQPQTAPLPSAPVPSPQPRASPAPAKPVSPSSVQTKKLQPVQISLGNQLPNGVIVTADLSLLELNLEHGTLMKTEVVSLTTQATYDSIAAASQIEPEGIFEVRMQTKNESNQLQDWKWTVTSQQGRYSWKNESSRHIAYLDSNGQPQLLRIQKPQEARLVAGDRSVEDGSVFLGESLRILLPEGADELSLTIDGKDQKVENGLDELEQKAVFLKLPVGTHQIILNSAKKEILNRSIHVSLPLLTEMSFTGMLAGLIRGFILHQRMRRFG